MLASSSPSPSVDAWFEALPSVAFALDGEGRVVAMSRGAVNLVGCPRDAAAGRSVGELLGLSSSLRRELDVALKAGEPAHLDVPRATDATTSAGWDLTPVGTDRASGYVFTAAPPKEAGTTSATMLVARERRDRSALLVEAAQELRSTLALVYGPLAELLGWVRERPIRQPLEVARRHALRLEHHVNVLLDVARLEAGRLVATFSPTNLTAATLAVADRFRAIATGAGLRFDVACAPLREPVWVDREAWNKIVRSLLANAYKFTFDGGITVRLTEIDGEAVLSVEDTGLALHPDEAARVFDQLDGRADVAGRTEEGAGVGLALAADLVHLHGGRIHAEGRSKGARFEVRLPFGVEHLPAARRAPAGGTHAPDLEAGFFESLRREHETVPEAPALEVPSPDERPCILVAEPHHDMRLFLRGLLEPRYRVREATDGPAALAVAAEASPDLVLVGSCGPPRGGTTWTRELRGILGRAVPVLLISARAGADARLEALGIGADDFITKPFEPEDLLGRARVHLELSRLRAASILRAGHARSIDLPLATLAGGVLCHDADGACVYANELSARALGLPLVEVRIFTLQELLARLRGRPTGTFLEDLNARGGAGTVDITVGEATFECHAAAGTSGLFAFFSDVTARRRREDEIRRREALLREAVDNIPEALWLRSVGSPRTTYLSRVYETLFGIPRSPTQDDWTLLLELVHPDDRAAVERQLLALPEGGMDIEYRLNRPDGELRWIRAQSRAVLRPDGTGIIVGIGRDVTEQHRLEERLRESELAYRTLFDDNPIAMALYERESLRLVAVNAAAVRELGYSRDELLAMRMHELHAPDGRHELLRVGAREGDAEGRKSWRLLRKDGAIRHVEIALQDMTFEGRPCRLALLQDVTELRDMMAALADSERLLEESQRLANLGYWWRDLATGEVVWSAPLKEMFGLPRGASLLYDHVLELVHPDDRHSFMQTIAHAVMEQRSFDHVYRVFVHGEVRVVHERGQVVTEQGKAVRLFGSVQDITERHRIERGLRESEERATKLAEVANDAVWDWNLATDEVWRSEGYFRTFGFPRGPMVITVDGWYERTHPDDAARVLRGLHAAIRSGERHWRDEYRYLRTDGTWADVVDRGYVLYDTAGNPVRMIGGMRDVTEERRALAEVQRLNAELEDRVRARTTELEEANRELEAFSYSVSHDLRAPLRAIGGFTRILGHEHATELSEPAQELLQRVQRSATQMAQLVDDLLSLSRFSRQPVVRTPVSMTDLVHECLAPFREEIAARGVEVTCMDLPPCRADRGLLRQVLTNLLSNALKYSRARPKPRVEIGAFRSDGGEVVYYVRDNGVGFEMQYAGKLFGVFQRLHAASEYEGTGVGLAIVKRLVEKHGGQVWLEARPEAGTRAYFTLGKDG